KLAVVPARGTLVLGQDLAASALEVAERVAGERAAALVQVPALDPAVPLQARGPFQRRNFALARAVAEAHLALAGVSLSEEAVAAAAAETSVPGRLQLLDGDPPTLLDGAHNPDAASGRWLSCSACSRTRTPLRCLRPCCRCARGRGSPPRRAAGRCLRLRSSRSRARWASTRRAVSRDRCRRWLGPGTGHASVTALCWPPARSISSETCSASSRTRGRV